MDRKRGKDMRACYIQQPAHDVYTSEIYIIHVYSYNGWPSSYKAEAMARSQIEMEFLARKGEQAGAEAW